MLYDTDDNADNGDNADNDNDLHHYYADPTLKANTENTNDGKNQGVGVLEQIIFGPYSPAGFKEFNDGFLKS